MNMDDSYNQGDKLVTVKSEKMEDEDLILKNMMSEEAKEKSFLEKEEER